MCRCCHDGASNNRGRRWRWRRRFRRNGCDHRLGLGGCDRDVGCDSDDWCGSGRRRGNGRRGDDRCGRDNMLGGGDRFCGHLRHRCRFRIGLCRRGCLLRRRLLDRLGLFGLFGPRQAVANRATFEAIGLCLNQRRGMALHSYAHGLAQAHHLSIRHSELLRELVYAHVLRQNPFNLSLAPYGRNGFRRLAILACWQWRLRMGS